MMDNEYGLGQDLCSEEEEERKMSGSGDNKASGTTKTPADFLKSIRGRSVVVKLNSGVDYRGSCSFGHVNWYRSILAAFDYVTCLCLWFGRWRNQTVFLIFQLIE